LIKKKRNKDWSRLYIVCFKFLWFCVILSYYMICSKEMGVEYRHKPLLLAWASLCSIYLVVWLSCGVKDRYFLFVALPYDRFGDLSNFFRLISLINKLREITITLRINYHLINFGSITCMLDHFFHLTRKLDLLSPI
jgi:hypothetical protein